MSAILHRTYPWTQEPFLVSAPMGGYAGAKLAVEVSKAGGLGFIGAGADLNSVDAELSKARELAAQADQLPKDVLPVGIGFLCFAMDVDKVIELIVKHKPAAVWLFSVHQLKDFAEWVAKIRQNSKVPIWIQTGAVSHALEIARTCDAANLTLVLQGIDAGGHGAIKGASIISLLPEVADVLSAEGFSNIPLVAAGGIADHRGVAASLILGAAGATLGSRFLASEEVKLPHPSVRDAILSAKDGGQSTLKSQVFDNMNTSITWPSYFDGRALRNATSADFDAGASAEDNRIRYVEAAKGSDKGYGSTNRSSIWCGTSVGLIRDVKPAAQIVNEVQAATKKLMAANTSRL